VKTQIRDDAIARNRHTLRLLMVACLSEGITILVLAGLALYAFMAKEVIYIPTNGSGTYKVSQLSFSPSYLQGIASDVMQDRLTWNENTIVNQYMKILSMVSAEELPFIRKQLNAEIKSVKKRNMTSVFYQKYAPLVDVKNKLAQVSGVLQRIDHGVVLPPKPVSFQIQFKYTFGTLQIVSISEVKKNA
jgi:type IV conjugative transfer system protein TraE